MKNQSRLMGTIFSCSLLQGCFCVGCFVPQLPPTPEPYVTHWEKPGMTEESRLQDWVACGGGENGNFSSDYRKMHPDETQEQARTRQSFAHQRCLIQQGYRYTGDCSSAYMKARPLCGAP